MKDSLSDTIAAISTPLGEGGIGVIRISGHKALHVLTPIFLASNQQKPPDSHRLYHGYIINPKTKDKIDEVMAVYMKSPDTYTGEDTVEISGHSGTIILNKIIEQILAQGARLASRGEFTKRAFVNGCIDLSQAEAVIDLIRAKTSDGAKAAMQQLEGGLSRRVSAIREKLVALLMSIEASLDLGPDVIEIDGNQVEAKVGEIKNEINNIIASSDTGRILREGVSAVIIGRPNVGKSSLLNALLRHERAIVTDVPGTTRDSIEDMVSIQGLPFKLIDTAGIREAENKIEEIGIARTKAHLSVAEMILLVIDLSEQLTRDDRELLTKHKDRKMIVVLNKKDKQPRIQESEIGQIVGEAPQVRISALTGDGVADLEETIINVTVNRRVVGENDAIVTNMRHKESLDKARDSLDRALNSLAEGYPLDLISIDVKDAIIYLGEVGGETVSEEVINRIFEEFCVGK